METGVEREAGFEPPEPLVQRQGQAELVVASVQAASFLDDDEQRPETD